MAGDQPKDRPKEQPRTNGRDTKLLIWFYQRTYQKTTMTSTVKDESGFQQEKYFFSFLFAIVTLRLWTTCACASWFISMIIVLRLIPLPQLFLLRCINFVFFFFVAIFLFFVLLCLVFLFLFLLSFVSSFFFISSFFVSFVFFRIYSSFFFTSALIFLISFPPN